MSSMGVVSFSYTAGFRAEHRQHRLPASAGENEGGAARLGDAAPSEP